MIDTVYLSIHQALTPAVQERLGLLPRGYSREGDPWSSGSAGNMSVIVNQWGTNVKGSLARYLNGENLRPFPRSDVSVSIEKLADDLEVPEPYIREAPLRRVDYGVNLVVPAPPSAYLRALRDPGVVERRNHGWKTATYGVKPVQVAFYDKLLQMRRKHSAVWESKLRDAYEGKHVLRVEVRHLKELKEQFKRSIVLGDLDDESFFSGLSTRVQSEVEKFAAGRSVLTGMCSDVQKMKYDLQRAGIEARGGQDDELARIAEMRQAGIVTRSTAGRMRSVVERSMAESPSTHRRDLGDELVALTAMTRAQLMR